MRRGTSGRDGSAPAAECRGTLRQCSGRIYGFTTFAIYFTPRQLVALTTFSDLVGEARDKASGRCSRRGLADDDAPLHAGGTGAAAYADAVATYLAFAVDRAADYGSSLATWLTDDNAIRGTFGRQALPMTWDFCEGNYFGSSSAAFSHYSEDDFGRVSLMQVATGLGTDRANGRFRRTIIPVRPCLITLIRPTTTTSATPISRTSSTSGSGVHSLSIWPDLFRRLTTPKDEELVATPYRHGGRAGGRSVLHEGHERGADCDAARRRPTGEPLAIYYAFKQSELRRGRHHLCRLGLVSASRRRCRACCRWHLAAPHRKCRIE